MHIGAHVSCSGGIHTAVERAVAIGCDSVQLFTQSPRMWRPTNHDPANIDRFRELRAKAKLRGVLCHALYLVNLASPDEEIYRKSIDTLRQTVDVASSIGADAVVFHVGSHLGSGFEAGLERIVPAIAQVLERCGNDTWLCIENSAGAGGTVGRSIEELATLVERLDGHPRLGVCLDSCHLYVSGYDVTDRPELDRILGYLDRTIGLDRLRCVHVNDSKAPLGSNRDRHENVGKGLIGEALGVFLAHPDLQGLPATLETPGRDNHGPDAEQVQRAKDLRARFRRSGGSRRRRGTSAPRQAARRTRG